MRQSHRRTGIYDPTGLGKLLFAFFAAMAETERENIRESTLEGLGTAARKGNDGGGPPVITDDMLHTVLRRRAGGESVEQIHPHLIIPTGKRKGQNPSVASTYRALAEHAKREAYPKPSSRPTPTSQPSKRPTASLSPARSASSSP
ncbi:recombinase family protein [Streptomyces sp. NPDC014864]|uniref:recombinase family protein n=1 Tax=Streptomyces sp. NPDC014864 TaxID=3364924 RepID=UPI0036FFF3E1